MTFPVMVLLALDVALSVAVLAVVRRLDQRLLRLERLERRRPVRKRRRVAHRG